MNKESLKLLVVDDEPFILKLTSKILNSIGYACVDTVTNGQQALEMIVEANPPFDVLICDLNMPDMDGVELIRHVTETTFAGAVILQSGEDQRMLDSTIDLAQAFRLNVLGAIKKPLQPALINELLDRYIPANNTINPGFMVEPITNEELHKALANDFSIELIPYFQPKVSVQTGAIIGMETLARWKHETRGILGPGAFIPLAEKTGLIDELSVALYRKALYETSRLADLGHNLKCSINFSINSFNTEGFTDFIVDTALVAGVPFERIILEITESQVMENALNCLEVIMRLRLKKFGLSIDDFGTGNSSMTQLKKIPFNELKLDQSFVHGVSQNSSALAILESSADLAKKLGMSIVAEGVENKEDWDIVEQLGCDIVQGFYCSRPLDIDNFTRLLTDWKGPHN